MVGFQKFVHHNELNSPGCLEADPGHTVPCRAVLVRGRFVCDQVASLCESATAPSPALTG